MKRKMKRLALAIAFCFLLLCTFFDVDIVKGDSMSPTIENGSIALSIPFLKDAKIGDVVQFKLDGEYYIKRVVASDGDIVSIQNGQVEVNGIQISNGLANKNDKVYIVVPKGEFYVLGDNRLNSVDSRSFGTVKKSSITGKIVFTFNR